MKVDELKAPIDEELRLFEQKFREVMRSEVALLDKITYYIVQRKGKQVRPMFIFLTAKMCGQVNDATYTGASLVELLHTATLVHDDVVDDAYERRGFFSVNAIWKNKIAVLVGDYFFAKGLLLALDKKQYRLLHIVSNAVKRMSEGELMQMEKARRLDIDESVYFEIIRNKTASLIASACETGAASATDDDEVIEKCRLLGEKIGMAFQIKDDLFDYGEADIGKPRGIDIKERKMTLPFIYVMSICSNKERRWMINTIKNHNHDAIRVHELIRFVIDKGGIEYTIKTMQRFRQEAWEILDTFPDNVGKEGLRELVDYITERKY
jgi:octaprenyl-diphosphate synthase